MSKTLPLPCGLSAIQLGADADVADHFGMTPAQHALQHFSCSHKVLAKLARGGANVFRSPCPPGLAVIQQLEIQLEKLGIGMAPDRIEEYVLDMQVGHCLSPSFHRLSSLKQRCSLRFCCRP